MRPTRLCIQLIRYNTIWNFQQLWSLTDRSRQVNGLRDELQQPQELHLHRTEDTHLPVVVSTFSTSLHTKFCDTGDPLLHLSFIDSREHQAINISKNQRTDIPLKDLSLNCQSIVGKKAPFETMCNTIGADIVFGTESWLSDQHLSTDIFPNNYKLYRRDRKKTRKEVGPSSWYGLISSA